MSDVLASVKVKRPVGWLGIYSVYILYMYIYSVHILYMYIYSAHILYTVASKSLETFLFSRYLGYSCGRLAQNLVVGVKLEGKYNGVIRFSSNPNTKIS